MLCLESDVGYRVRNPPILGMFRRELVFPRPRTKQIQEKSLFAGSGRVGGTGSWLMAEYYMTV